MLTNQEKEKWAKKVENCRQRIKNLKLLKCIYNQHDQCKGHKYQQDTGYKRKLTI